MITKPQAALLRNTIYSGIREFFSQRNVIEVETPVLSQGISTDPNIDVFCAEWEHQPGKSAGRRYLQTSPELHMKRLLCEGFPSIFQISKVFRNGEVGNLHNPEFSMLEWYRIGFSMDMLIDETINLCIKLLGDRPVMSKSYHHAFMDATGIDPLSTSLPDLSNFAQSRSPAPLDFHSITDALQFIMATHVEPAFPQETFVVIHHYPVAQAVLSKVDENDSRTAKRFEIYLNGHELGNGYEELLNWRENEKRMQDDNQRRKDMGKPEMPIDGNFLEAMKKEMPFSSGIAMGLDRIIMLAAGASSIKDVLLFPWDEA